MNWFKIAQLNDDASAIIAALLVEAGQNPTAPIEDVGSRLMGYSPEKIQEGLTKAQAQVAQMFGGSFNEAQQNMLTQIQAMLAGGPTLQPTNTEQQAISPMEGSPDAGPVGMIA